MGAMSNPKDTNFINTARKLRKATARKQSLSNGLITLNEITLTNQKQQDQIPRVSSFKIVSHPVHQTSNGSVDTSEIMQLSHKIIGQVNSTEQSIDRIQIAISLSKDNEVSKLAELLAFKKTSNLIISGAIKYKFVFNCDVESIDYKEVESHSSFNHRENII